MHQSIVPAVVLLAGLALFPAEHTSARAAATAGRQRATPPAARDHTLTHLRYRLTGDGKPLGYTELTVSYRPDGSRTFLARERMEFWGPVLERFVVLTFDARGHFDSGHWVGTSRYSPAFRYTFRFDGQAIRADWEDDVRGRGWADVPASAEDPLLGFWGPLESLLLERFDPNGPARQQLDAVDVEDSHHRRVRVSAERIGRESIDVPAGRFDTTHYRTDRFGTTDHWLDDTGTVVRWHSEGGAYAWELERAPSASLPPRGRAIASGAYDVIPAQGGTLRGSTTWTIAAMDDGRFVIVSDERLETRRSHFEGTLDSAWNWLEATETTEWLRGEAPGGPERHYQALYFFRDRIHVVRLRDGASPLVQSRVVKAPAPFLPVNHPVCAIAFLRTQTGPETKTLPELAHIASRYRGNGLEVQAARLTVGASRSAEAAAPGASGRRWTLAWDGGWTDSTVELTTDDRLVPVLVQVNATDGPVSYRASRIEVQTPAWLAGPSEPAPRVP